MSPSSCPDSWRNFRCRNSADFSPTGERYLLLLAMMSGLQQFIRSRRSGAVVAICLAYALAIQALVASVGLGMSAFALTDVRLLFCNHSPAPSGDPQRPSPAPQCPFCFVAAQSAGHIATMGEAPTFPAYAGLSSAAILDPIGAGAFVFQLRHGHGEPRAPPAFSV
jgi:hypothetical protein